MIEGKTTLNSGVYFYLFLIGVIFLSIYQFITPISYLPITIPFENLMFKLGLLGIYISTISLGILMLSFKEKVAKVIGLILTLSLFLSLIPQYNISYWWEFVEVFTFISGSALCIEALLKSKRWVLLPILTIVEFGEIEGIVENFFHTYIDTSFLALLAILIIFGATLLFYRWKPRRLLGSFLVGLPGILLYLPLYFIVIKNRFMETIFAMVFPAVYGISLNNPFNVPLMILLYAVALFLSLALGYHIDVYTGLGFYMIISTVFLGLTGFHLFLYMVFPLIGFYFMNVKGKISPTVKDYITSMRNSIRR
ncbi:hypothetical protein [Stygiolobus caldivivus]|uniref:Cytochrome b558/566 subunit B n=1 Tax=Stygiolobus caldivivus TaxID=2824673 RepID=A0A8D5ZKP3_9CREN|nr:hypothetical protein [Stygiolobus caldivivus]BCU71492.1 hypothetical protein KN1_27890 [Stygiolobus caldivivus]